MTSPLSSTWCTRPRLSYVVTFLEVRQLPLDSRPIDRLVTSVERRDTRSGSVERDAGAGSFEVQAVRVLEPVSKVASGPLRVFVVTVPPAAVKVCDSKVAPASQSLSGKDSPSEFVTDTDRLVPSCL